MKKALYISLLTTLLLVSCSKKAPVPPVSTGSTTATWTVEATSTGRTTETWATTTATWTTSTWTTDAIIGGAKSADNVEVHYTGKLKDGSIFDSSYKRNKPLPFTIWAGQMIPGFDKAVVGMKVGDKKTVTLEPEDAYGNYDPKAIIEVKRSQFAELEKKGFKIQAGAEVPTQFWPLLIKEVKWEAVTIDVNHKLAWKTLIFDIEMVKIN